MSSCLSEEREAVARARGVQDHEAGFRTRLRFLAGRIMPKRGMS